MTLEYNDRSSDRYVPVRSDVWWNSIVMYMRTGTRETLLCDSRIACLVALRATTALSNAKKRIVSASRSRFRQTLAPRWKPYHIGSAAASR